MKRADTQGGGLTEAQKRTRRNLRVLRHQRWVAVQEIEAIRREIREALAEKKQADAAALRESST
jgi:hypothetical protein